jgi:ApbE superfamily uncharacterized protein (UPF0280 family)
LPWEKKDFVTWEKSHSMGRETKLGLWPSRVTSEVYRTLTKATDLMTCRVLVKETDMLVSGFCDLLEAARAQVLKYRGQIEGYISRHPSFARSLVPMRRDPFAPEIVNTMIEASSRCGVGPMASVAGAIADYVGNALLPLTRDVIVENGGDIFISSQTRREVLLLAEGSGFEDLKITIGPHQRPCGVCTSSGKLGHSLSFGRADAVTVVGASASIADAAATGIANMIQAASDIKKGLERAKEIGVLGVIILSEGHMGAWGQIEIGSSQ